MLFVCRENLSKDLYLISQMDSDQFVSIWTVACMEDIKALTSDTDLILDVLKGTGAAALTMLVYFSILFPPNACLSVILRK